MKTAIVFHGLTGVYGKYGQGASLDLSRPFNSFKKNILDCNDNIDIFIHSWTTEKESEVLNLYNPVLYKFETQKIFDVEYTVFGRKFKGYNLTSGEPDKFMEQMGIRFHSMYSKWYSAKQSIKLKQEHEKKYNFKYDMTMLLRFDLGYNKKFIFSEFDAGKIYVTACPAVEADKGLSDLYVLSTSEICDRIFGDDGIFDYIQTNTDFPNDLFHNHYHLKKIIDTKNLTDKIHKLYPERTAENTNSIVYVDRDLDGHYTFQQKAENPLNKYTK